MTALLPFVGAVLVGKATIDRLGSLATQPELGVALERALGVYGDLATALKDGMRHEAASMAAQPVVVGAARSADRADDDAALERIARDHPRTISLVLETPGGRASFTPGSTAGPAPPRPGATPGGSAGAAPASVESSSTSVGASGQDLRGDPSADPSTSVPDPSTSVRRVVGQPAPKQLTVRAPVPGTDATLVVVLETSGARFAEQEQLAAFERAHRELASSRRSAYVETPHLVVLTLVMLVTIAIAAGAGALLARPVAVGVERLSAALRSVAAGDLTPRIRFDAPDELGALGRAFNATILELDRSRARIEFLRHMSEWQTIARRLAHEIRNPLTPIQLAVQECQKQYDGSDPAFAQLLGTTVEVVEEEIASLRRLVGRFARFARLPDAELTPCDLGDVLREQGAHLALGDRVSTTSGDEEDAAMLDLDLEVEVEPGPIPVQLDREMFHRALVNLVRNAAQAIQGAPRLMGGPTKRGGCVRLRAGEDAEGPWVAVDDDGPGVEPEVRETLFDPYVTTKRDGTGLGLSIVKKIVLDHGGRVVAAVSPEGGARILIRLPRAEDAVSTPSSTVPTSTVPG